MTARFARVYLLDAPYHIDRLYEYYLPVLLDAPIRAGSIVAVPFGAANRRSYALVASLSEESEQANVKPVVDVLPERFSLTEEMLGLCYFLKEYTLCSVGDAVRCMLPGAALSEIAEYYEAADEGGEDIPLVAYLREHGRTRQEMLVEALGIKQSLLSELVARSLIIRSYELKEAKEKTEQTVTLSGDPAALLAALDDPDEKKRYVRTEAQERILRALCADGRAVRSELCTATHTTPAQVAQLVKRGLLLIGEEVVVRDPYAGLARGNDRSPILLSRAQSAAFDELLSLYTEGVPRAALLHGVTGSGKTKVMMKLIDRVIADGRQAIVLVPEIALTPQTVGIFCARYGDRVAVVHSALGEGERFDAWRRAADGEIDLVIGTRSAIFTPLKRLGLIVMDEEHEHTYKSESDPKYHTRDVAAFRCARHNALLLLASATPSLESYYRAEQGRYRLVSLRERYGGATLPSTELVDMREELRAGNRTAFSDRLLEALRETVERGEQAILFLNRRGFHTSVQCKDCGAVLTCPHCSVALAYHTDRLGGGLRCHLCGARSGLPRTCPECGGEHISFLGFGTQRVESELQALLPEARVLRMDADTTGGKQSYDRLLGAFRAGEADILLGTQMVTKGHDFSRVTLVGVLLADTSLYVNDFRAAERTFELLTQVIGRAGRAGVPGRAIIQTYAPGNETIRLACAQDYEGFYRAELAMREATLFPPFCDLVTLTLSSSYENEVLSAATLLAEDMRKLAETQYPDLPLTVFGPFEAGVYKMAGKFRMRLVAKCRGDRRTRAYLAELLHTFGQKAGRRVALSIDRNPIKA